MYFFHNPDEENGYLSNWYPCDFVHKGIKFSSSEQAMMWEKAKLFSDEQTADNILSVSDCGRIKALGREVRNFDEKTWGINRERIMYEILLDKFKCNDKLARKLKDTGDEVLAECAVMDRIWGIGLSMKDPDRFDQSKWRGRNLLGYSLMRVRESLQE